MFEKKRPEIKKLLKQLKNGTIYEKREAAKQLGKFTDRRAVAPLIEALRTDKDFWLRWVAARSLGELGYPEAVPSLIESLREDPEDIVRSYAAWALGQLSDRRAIQPLKEAQAVEQSVKALHEIELALETISQRIGLDNDRPPETIEQRVRTCFHCGNPIEKEIKHCPSCGKEILHCPVCKQILSFEDEIVYCVFCEVKGHANHMKEAVKISGICPICRRELNWEQGLIPFSREAKKITKR